ncbi:class I SAM-dependent methyltransferase, partial [Streptomyces sp. McG7]|nr:class I SAM-dependent methyltransferase [Streptomyces sp. McG7]
PWRAIPPSPADQRLRTAVLGAGTPLVIAAGLADLALSPLARHTPLANSYRVIARKPKS